jgi:hypothetical protein
MRHPRFAELVIMFVICLLLVGPRWLPLLGRDLGQTIREARQAVREQGYSPELVTVLIVLFVLSFVYGMINTFKIFS